MFEEEISAVREYVESRAAFHRLVFSPATDDETLLLMVMRSEGKYSAKEGTQPACFGQRWSAVEADACQRCRLQTLCLKEFAFQTIPQVKAKLAGASATDIAQLLDTEASAPPFAAAFVTYVNEGTTPECPPITLPPPTVGTKQHSALGATLPALIPSSRAVSALHHAAQSAVAPAVVSPIVEQSQPQRTRHPRTYNPPRARMYKNGRLPYGEHTFQARFQRERKRNPKLNLLQPGTKISRYWNSPTGVQLVSVKVETDGYTWKQQKFPTLYDVTKAITGAVAYQDPKRKNPRYMSNWSGTRFFKEPLRLLLESQQI
jgi:hypothetical protein